MLQYIVDRILKPVNANIPKVTDKPFKENSALAKDVVEGINYIVRGFTAMLALPACSCAQPT